MGRVDRGNHGNRSLGRVAIYAAVPLSHRTSWHTEQTSSDRMVSYYLLISVEFISFLVPFTPSPTQLPVSTITAAAITTARTTMMATIRVNMFTVLTVIAVAVAVAHASTLPHIQPNLRQRQSANSTIQWQRCTNAPAECAKFTYVCHNTPSQNNMPNPSIYQKCSTRLCKSSRWNHPDRYDTLPSRDTPS